MNLITVGTSYKYSPLNIREQLAFSKKEKKNGLEYFKDNHFINGALILTTCNRTEIYVSTDSPNLAKEQIGSFLSKYKKMDNDIISFYTYSYKNQEALKHLISVTAGLDSLVLGETQIKAQVKKAYFLSKNINVIDKFLEKVFVLISKQSKKIHNETKIAEGKVSVGSVAYKFIKQILGNLNNKKVIIIGTGKISKLVLNHIKKENPKILFIANRTYSNAEELAANIGAKASRFDNLKENIADSDLIVSATASPHYIIKKDSLSEKRSRPLLLIDLAVPRDIQPQVSEFKNVDLFSLEDMKSVINENIRKKEKEAEKAKQLIDNQINKIWQKLTKLEQEEAILH